MGGIVVTFANWRIIFWVQTAMAGFGLVLSLLFVSSMKDGPKMIHSQKKQHARFYLVVLNMFNPWRIIRKFAYPNVFLAVRIIQVWMHTFTLLTK